MGRLHDHCMRNFFRVQQAERCPVCKKEWPGDKFVGERAMASSNRRPGSNVHQMPEPSSAPDGHATGSDENEEEDEG